MLSNVRVSFILLRESGNSDFEISGSAKKPWRGAALVAQHTIPLIGSQSSENSFQVADVAGTS